MDAGLGAPHIVGLALAASLSSGEEDVSILAEAAGAGCATEALALARAAAGRACSGDEAAALLGLPEGFPVSAAAWRVPAPRGTAIALFTRQAAAQAAARLLETDPPEAGLGIPLPEEAAMRMSAAGARPRLAGHFRSTAADVLAAYVMQAVASLPGSARLGNDCVAWAGSFPPGGHKAAFSWLAVPGPGRYACAIAAALPEGGA